MRPSDPIERVLTEVTLPAEADEALHGALRALRDGRVDEVLALFDGSAATPDALHLVGLAHLRRADAWRAAAALERALAAEPDAFWLLRTLAAVRETQETYDEAAELLRRALQARPDDPGAIAALARCYNALGRLSRAEALARRGLELSPGDRELLGALVETLQRQDRHPEAVEALGEARDGELAVALARSLLHLGRGEEARALFAEALRRDAESPDALAGMAEALAQTGHLAEAPGYVLRALATAPDRVDLHLFHARLLLALGRHEAAETAAIHAASLEPDEPAGYVVAMQAARAGARMERASAHARDVLRLLPDDAEALAVRALALVAAGEAAEALALVSPRLVGDDTPVDLRLAAGAALTALGQPEAAEEHLRHLGDDALARDLRGLAADGGEAGREVRRRLGAVEADDDDDAVPDESLASRSSGASRRPTSAVPSPVEAVVSQILGPRADARRPTGPLASISALATPPLPAPASDPPPPASVPPLAVEGTDGVPEPPSMLAPPAPLPSVAATEALARLHAVRRLIADEPALADLRLAVERLVETHDQPLLLAILGPPGAGKTTFVNALIGSEVIPEGTRVALMLRYGSEPGGRVLYRDGRVSTVRIRDLRAFLEANEEALSAAAVRLVEVLVPIEELTRASILDLPDPLAPGDSEPLLAEADAALWLVGADQPAKHWREAAHWLGRGAIEAVAVVTRVDAHDEARVAKAASRAERALGRRVHGVAAVSARLGLDGLARRDVEAVRASGFGKLHRLLRQSLFDRAAVIRQAAVRLRLRRILAKVLARLDDRLEALGHREAAVTRIARRIEDQQRAFAAEVGPEVVDALGRDIQQAGGRRGVGEAVDALRASIEARLTARLDALFDELETIFAGGADDTIAARVAALRGIIDGYRQLRFEEIFGRHRAYLEGWIDRAPSGRDLALDRARPLKLEGLADALFDGLAAFAEEAAGELREARADLARRLVEPLEHLARSSGP